MTPAQRDDERERRKDLRSLEMSGRQVSQRLL